MASHRAADLSAAVRAGTDTSIDHWRAATERDLGALVELVQAAYRGDAGASTWTSEATLISGQRTDEAQLRTIIETDDSLILLAINADDELLGSFQLERRSQAVAYFGMFAIWPELHGGGLGRTILAHAETMAQQLWRSHYLEMTVIGQRAELIQWYERRGYRRTGEQRPFPYGRPAFGTPRRPDLYFEVLRKQL